MRCDSTRTRSFLGHLSTTLYFITLLDLRRHLNQPRALLLIDLQRVKRKCLMTTRIIKPQEEKDRKKKTNHIRHGRESCYYYFYYWRAFLLTIYYSIWVGMHGRKYGILTGHSMGKEYHLGWKERETANKPHFFILLYYTTHHLLYYLCTRASGRALFHHWSLSLHRAREGHNGCTNLGTQSHTQDYNPQRLER
jgi:hypothetical protein